MTPKADFRWTTPLAGEGIGGLAVADNCVVIGCRDLIDRSDVFQCFAADTGEMLWQHFYPAPGELDYGNSPRATPLIHDGLVYTLGAHGHLYCLELESGLPFWNLNIAEKFQSPEMTWGHSGSPLIADGKLIVQPGGPQSSLVALNPETGEVLWKTPGQQAGYSSFVAAKLGGISQLVGYDQHSLGGWETKTGRRLWTLFPPEKGDFNVPTPVLLNDSLLVATENNGARRYSFETNGKIVPDHTVSNPDLVPDSHTPVVIGDYIVGISEGLYVLDAKTLKTVSVNEDDAFAVYGSLVASENRLLCFSGYGELLLLGLNEGKVTIESRLQITDSVAEALSHPAVAGDAVFIRRGEELFCLPLAIE